MALNVWPEELTLGMLWDEAVQATVDRENIVDPLRDRLHAPDFADLTWENEYGHVGPQPGQLHDKQNEARMCGARHRFLFWGNQVGKSSSSAADWAEIALGRHPVYSRWPNFTPPVTLWASSLTWDLWETIQLPELLSWIPHDRIVDAPEPFARSMKRRIVIRADNGKESVIEGKSAEQGRAKYQARRIHGIWFDEEHPEDIWFEARTRLVRFGGISLHSMTALKGFTWVYYEIYEPWRKGEYAADDVFCSHAGLADNPVIRPEEIEALKHALRNNRAQLEARLYGHFTAPEGLALSFDPQRHFQHWSADEIRAAVADERLKPFAGIDFGSWRFAFVLCAADRAGRAHVLDEHFSHREDLTTRAKALAQLLQRYGIEPGVRIWGDAANQQDIIELNAAWKRLGHSYRVMPVAAEGKARAASVERLNDLLGRQALLFRRGLGSGLTWRLGMDAAHDGHPVTGSRLLWEVQNWSYPEMAEGKAQKQDPDDNTADGADAIAGLRYAVMSWWKGAAVPEIPKKEPKDTDDGLDKLMELLNQQNAAYVGGQKKISRRKNAVKRVKR